MRRSLLSALAAVAGFEALKLWQGAEFTRAFAAGFIVCALIAFWEVGQNKRDERP